MNRLKPKNSRFYCFALIVLTSYGVYFCAYNMYYTTDNEVKWKIGTFFLNVAMIGTGIFMGSRKN